MNIRCIEILNLFINSNGEQHVDFLASKFGISKRMIRYDIDEINSFLKQNNIKEIEKKPNSPLKFYLSKEEKDSLENILNNINAQSYIFSTEERVGILLYELLSSTKECTYSTLQSKLAISKTTLVNDIKKVKNWLSKYNINVIKISNKGIKIEGEEGNIRKAMISLLIENNKYNILETLEKIYNNGNKNIIDNIRNFEVNKENINYIKDLVRDVEKELGVFSEEDFMNLVIAIFVIVNRHIAKKDKALELEFEDGKLNYGNRECGNYNNEKYENHNNKVDANEFKLGINTKNEKGSKNTIDIEYKEINDIDNRKNHNISGYVIEKSEELKEAYKKEYEATVQISNKLNEKFSISITDDEINIITSKILSGSKSENNIFDSRDYFNACYIADKLISNIKKLINKDFDIDSDLYENFIIHLKNLIFRLKYKVVSKNPILDTIVKNYNKEFILVKEAARFIEEKFQYPLSDDELGYLLMYIEAGIEKSKKEDKDKKNILIVCSAGFATGRLIEAKIKNNFKVNILGVTSIHNIKRFINLEGNSKVCGNVNSKKNSKEDNGHKYRGIENKQEEFDKVDYIISPIDIEDKYGVPIIKVSSMLSEEDMNKLKEVFILKKSFKNDNVKEFVSKSKEECMYRSNEEYLSESTLNESKLEKVNLTNLEVIKNKDINECDKKIYKSIHKNIEKNIVDKNIIYKNIIDKNLNKSIDNNVNTNIHSVDILQEKDMNQIIKNDDFYKELTNIIEKSCKILNKDNLINDLKEYFNIDNKATSLGRYIKEENIQLNLEANDWKEAIKLSAAPLLKNNYITEDYVEEMINNVEKLGPYIVVDDEIAIPHAKPGKYVNSFGITINTFKTPIVFGSHKDVRILITIASISSENHIDLITQIMKLIEDDKFIELLSRSPIVNKDEILKKINTE